MKTVVVSPPGTGTVEDCLLRSITLYIIQPYLEDGGREGGGGEKSHQLVVSLCVSTNRRQVGSVKKELMPFTVEPPKNGRVVCLLRIRRGYYSGTSDNGHSEEWTTSLQWTNCSPPAYILSIHFYLRRRTTSEQWTKCSSPKCPLFGGSTVEPFLSLSFL